MEHGRLTGWEVMATDDGNILQSGVWSRATIHHHDMNNTMGWITRAVVLQVYYADEDKRTGWVDGLQRCVLCDVRTYGRYQRILTKVPVLQRTQTLFDEDIYIPRGSRQDIEGGNVVAQPSGSKKPTPAEKLDGDHVLIGFLDNDPSQPTILPYMMPHPKATYTPKKADGHVRRIRHNGVSVVWDKDGNLTIDASGAAKEILAAQGKEASNSGTAGQIKLITSDGTNATSIHLNEQGQILFGSDTATASTEPIVLGTQWISVMESLIDTILAMTVGTGVGPSSTPINAADFLTIKSNITAKNHVSDFIFAKKAY